MNTKSKQYWQINTEKLASEIVASALNSDTEEDLKMKVEPLLQKAFEKIGVDINNVKYEKTSTNFRGRADAVYGYVTIEYKAPGKLFNKTEVIKVENQLKGYLEEQAKETGKQKEDFLEKAVGVALDGNNILFIRFTKKPTILQTPVPIEQAQMLLPAEVPAGRGFHVQGPYPISKSSISNLLIYMRASARRPLTASGLAKVFSPNCAVTQQAINEFYSELMRSQRRQVPSRIKTFYDEWDKIFGIVYGQKLTKAENTAETMAKLYQMPGGCTLKKLLFSIHTFYAFIMKLIAVELISMQKESSIESFVKDLSALDDNELKEQLSYLESGADFKSLGIENFLEADFFSWYLDGWNPKYASIFREIAEALSGFEPATPILEPAWTKDLLQNLYEEIVPQELRHDLGEYYTPDWLAGYLIDKSGYTGDSKSRFLDPACGSGTFLVQAINKAIEYYGAKEKKANLKEIGQNVLNNIAGFDLNPLAVLTARTNYLIAFSKFIPFVRPITIPVYLCDSILAPTRYEEDDQLPLAKTIRFTTTKENYEFPLSMQNRENIDKFAAKIDVALESKISPGSFAAQLSKEFSLPDSEINLLSNVYEQIKKLDDNQENGIWAKYIKNAFAPAFLGKFDYVIGNPPWIRWDFLSDDYRKASLKLWQKYGLFSLKGYATRLGGGKKDFSMLFTYSCADNYLKETGILGFVITMEVFKSKGAGEGFRRFELENSKIPLKILGMEDMVDLKPFSAANKTSIFLLKKNSKTKYPVPSVAWTRKKGVGRINPAWNLEEVLEKSKREQTKAIPVNPRKITSAWQTARSSDLKIFAYLKGDNPYRAHLGVNADPYGIFWLNLVETRPDEKIVIENLYDRGKSDIKRIRTQIEPDLIYPAVTGKDIIKFGIKAHFHILITQDPKKKMGYEEEWLVSNYPLTYAYLIQFKGFLTERALYKKYFFKEVKRNEKVIDRVPFAPFYSQYNISVDTFEKYRVTWKAMASRMSAVVLSSIKTDYGMKPIISTKVTSFIPTNNKSEAHYLCAIINSKIVNDFISSFSAAGRGFGTPSVMENLAIPKYDSEKKLHKKLAGLSEEAHNTVKRHADISGIEKEIDREVEKLWNIK